MKTRTTPRKSDPATEPLIRVDNGEPRLPMAQSLAKLRRQFRLFGIHDDDLAAIWSFCIHHAYTPKTEAF
jgi:hypothetical protein